MVQAWTIPKASRKSNKRRCDSPGPGNYNDINLNVVRVAHPEWTIKGKYPVKYHDGPGPGYYTDSYKRPSSAYTMGGKARPSKYGNDPGPAHYDVRRSYDGASAYINSRQEAMTDGWTFGIKYDPAIYDSPGPGSYNNRKNGYVTLGIIGKDKRRTTKGANYDSPGPGAYSQKSTLKRNGWTITGKPKERSSWGDIPGVGSYFPKIKDDAPAYSMPGKNYKKTRPSEGPSPGTYFPSISATHPRPKSAKFTSGRKDPK
jgi:hypothetical protein